MVWVMDFLFKIYYICIVVGIKTDDLCRISRQSTVIEGCLNVEENRT
jgi:hypothetical protein